MSKVTISSEAPERLRVGLGSIPVGTYFMGVINGAAPCLLLKCWGGKIVSLANPNHTWSGEYTVVDHYAEVDVYITATRRS